MKQTEHRGHSIIWSVEQPSGTQFWNARGCVEFYEGETFCSVNFTSAINKFTSAEEAEGNFLTKTKNWIDRRSAPDGRDTSSPAKL